MGSSKLFMLNYAYIVTLSGNLLALTGDTTLTWSSPILPKLNSTDPDQNPLEKPITEDEESWIGSLIYIGAMCGMLPFGYLADKIGRKPTLIILAIPHIIAYLSFAFAENINLYYFGRVLGGVSLSSVYMVLPMYVAEISEDSYRGMLLMSYSTFASFGDLLPYIIGPYLPILTFNVILAVFPIIFVLSFAVLAPESPYYYIKKNNFTAAKKSLIQLRSGNVLKIEKEIALIEEETSQKHKFNNKFEMFKSRNVIKGFIIALSLSSFQQLSGISAVLAYTQTIFEEAGTNISSDLSSIIVGIVLFIASFFGPLLVDRKGRKFLLICSASGMIVSELFLGTYFYLQDNTDINLKNFRWLPIICLVIYTITFNIGFGPLPFTVSSEILPSNVKFYVVTITGFMGWLVSFLVTKFFNDFNEHLGRGGTFWLFSSFCILALLFVVFYVPETKGKNFQEIQFILAK